MASDLQLHSLASSKRFRHKGGYSREPVRPDADAEEQQGSMLKWVVLLGVGVVGLKWWHDKQQLDQANAGSRRVGGTAKGLLGFLTGLFGSRRQQTLRYRGRAGRADASAAAASSSSQGGDSAAAEAAGTSSSSTQQEEAKQKPADKCRYDKATLSQFVDGQWVQLSKNARVSFSTSKGGLEELAVAWGSRELRMPASRELQLHGSASNKQVKFKLEGGFYSLEFPSAAAYQSFDDDFTAAVQRNQPMLLQQAQRQRAS